MRQEGENLAWLTRKPDEAMNAQVRRETRDRNTTNRARVDNGRQGANDPDSLGHIADFHFECNARMYSIFSHFESLIFI